MLEVGWGKVVCWSTEAAISPKCLKIEEKLLWKAYIGSHQRSFQRYHSRPTYGLLFPNIGLGSQPLPKTTITIISGAGKAMRISNSACVGAYIHSQGPSEQKHIKNLGERGVWAYPAGTAQIFPVPRIISGTGKATNFKFCTHIYNPRLNRNKTPSKIPGKVAVGVLRDSRNFSVHP